MIKKRTLLISDFYWFNSCILAILILIIYIQTQEVIYLISVIVLAIIANIIFFSKTLQDKLDYEEVKITSRRRFKT